MKILKSKFFITGFILLIIVTVGYFVFAKKPSVEYTTAAVVKGDLVQTVSETGVVKSTDEIDLNFPSSGKVANIYVKVGDKVKKDQVMAELNNSGLVLKAKEAVANLRVAEANLAKLLAGATNVELAVSQAGVDQAKTTYDAAVKELGKTQETVKESIRQAQKSLADLYLTSGATITSEQRDVQNYRAVALTTMAAKIQVADNALDNINTILSDSDSRNYLAASDVSLFNTTKDDYNLALLAVAEGQSSSAAAEAKQTDDNLNQALADTASALNKVFFALKDCYAMLEASMVGANFTQTELDTYKTNISAQQTNVAAGLTSVQTADHNFNDALNDLSNAISTAEDSLATAKTTGEQQTTAAQSKVDTSYAAWQVAVAQLNKLRAKPREQDVNLSQAQVSQAQAALDLVKNQIDDNIIKAPIDGIVTKKNYEIGEQVSSAKSVFSFLGTNNFEIEVDVSEADINKVALNNPAEITLDSFGDDVKFYGQVSFIEPAETVIQDVTYYRVKVNFDGQSRNVKSGMTANVNITTARKNDILIMLGRAVIEKNGNGRYARILIGKELKEVPVTIGLRGDDGLVEVLSGMNEGDKAVTYIKQGK
jgi:RND family efflux transporter MFP subunit